MEGRKVKEFLLRHYLLLAVLIASFLISFPMGTYSNWDAQVEYQAVSSILKEGYPYVTTGLIINQPPLGFYISAVFFSLFGSSYLNGVGLTTIFGLGCVAALYALGTVLYGRKTGIVAASIFGFIPWHVYMSRIFLIDNQYLLLSLVFLTVAVLAIRGNSERLTLVAGVVFGLAVLTKLFAIFALVPLLLFFVVNRNISPFRLDRRKILLFVLPSLLLQVLWFGGLANQHFFGVYFASDFTHPELVANPVLEFIPIVFVKSAGGLLFLATSFSLGVALAFRKKLKPILHLDLVCLGTVGAVVAFDMLLVLGFHLTVPYVSAVKYNYFALPFISLIAASIADKGILVNSVKPEKKIEGAKLVLIIIGLILIFSSMLESTLFLNAWYGFVSFGVDSVIYYGFYLNSPAIESSLLSNLHFFGFGLIICCLVFPSMFNLFRKALERKVKVQGTANSTVPNNKS